MTFKKNWLIILMIVLATLLTAKFALAAHSSPVATVNAVEGVEFVYQIQVTGTPGSQGYLYEQTSGAVLGVFNESTGQLTRTPEAEDIGSDTFVFTITDKGDLLTPDDDHSVTHTLTVNVAAQAPSFTISEVLFEDADRATQITKTITITNTGNVPLTGVTATHDIVVAGSFSPTASPLTVTPSTIPVGGTGTAILQITIPTSHDTGLSTIGILTVDSAETAASTANIRVDVLSGLAIGRVKINGKTSGDLSADEVNEITVEVENMLDDLNIEDIEVTIEIDDLDVDETESLDDDNLGNGQSDEAVIEFDLSDEDVDEDDYEMIITAEGEDEDGVMHTVEERFTVSVDRDRHRVSITDVTLSPSTLSCNIFGQQVRVEVDIKNVGSSDEDDVEIRVRNSELGVDERRDNIDLDDFSGSDNDYLANFEFNVDENIKAGTKRLVVEVYRDGTLDDTEEVSFTVPQCNDVVTGGETSDLDKIIEQIKKDLEESMKNQQEVPVVNSGSSLRESGSYLAVLSVLTVLLIVAVLLGLVILLVRKPKALPPMRESKR